MAVYIVQKIFSTASKTHEDIDMVFYSEEKAWNRIEKLYYTFMDAISHTFIDEISFLKNVCNVDIINVCIKDSSVMVTYGFVDKKRYALYRIVKRFVNE